MRTVKRRVIYGGIVTVAIVFVASAYYFYVQMTWVESPPYIASQNESKVLVVVYSRTGNTLAVAKKIARHFDADLIQIKAPQYGLTLEGQMLASDHADQQLTTTAIEHEPVDPANYDLIVLSSPTWWFRPAVPLWAFVENHKFGGNPVFLAMTGNSRYKAELTGNFAALVSKKNGKLLDVLFIRRGRVFWQKTPDEVSLEVKEAMLKRKKLWSTYLGAQ